MRATMEDYEVRFLAENCALLASEVVPCDAVDDIEEWARANGERHAASRYRVEGANGDRWAVLHEGAI